MRIPSRKLFLASIISLASFGADPQAIGKTKSEDTEPKTELEWQYASLLGRVFKLI